MTEYDYSPAAYDRYINTQNRVSNWVSQTKAHERRYANPFVPSAINGGPEIAPSHSREHSPRPHAQQQPERSRSSGSEGTIRARDMNTPKRSKTLDSRDSRGFGLEESSRDGRSSSQDPSRSRRPRSRSSHHSHSQSYSAYPHPPPLPPMPAPSPLRSNSVPPRDIVYVRGQEPIHLPAPRPGQTYVIVPPGRRVEMISTKGNYPHSPRGSYGGGGGYEGEYGKAPLLKRLLGSITGGGNQHGRSRSAEMRGRRRDSY
jgi:hypothetical protein